MHTLLIGSEYITEPGKNLSVAVGQFSSKTNVKKFFENPREYNLTVTNMTNKFTTNYSISIGVSGCYYFNENEEKWSTDGCKVSKLIFLNNIYFRNFYVTCIINPIYFLFLILILCNVFLK